jgi:ATP/maltotriose-dependent transcriptional regulator MalT/two-component SAPR family response regulator
MEFTITRTRIIPPRRRSELISRPRLLNALNDLLDKKLIIIAAPAGYGKTSLMVDFASQGELPICWYTINQIEQDTKRFISYIIASIQHQFPEFGRNSYAALRSAYNKGELDLDTIITTIVNDAYENISEHFVLVVDDFHLVDKNKSINYFINRFSQDVDENCHIIVISRNLMVLPDLPLMVARAQVGGLSFEELAFSPQEIQNYFFQNYEISISSEEAKDLNKRTEGWITGLLLSTQIKNNKIKQHSFKNLITGIGLNEYFEQIFSQETQEVQTFLLRSSLLEEFDANLFQNVICSQLNCPDNWHEIMQYTFSHNLFILPIDSEGVWLRFHHLFLDFLQEKMTRDFPHETELIEVRLAKIHEENQEWSQAFEIYQRYSQKESIYDLIREAGPQLIIEGHFKLLEEWLKILPPDAFEKYPIFYSLQGSVIAMKGHLQESLEFFEKAISRLEGKGISRDLASTYVRQAAVFRLLNLGDKAILAAQNALNITENDSDLRDIQAETYRAVGVSLYQEGKLVKASEWLQKALDNYRECGNPGNAAIVMMEIGVVEQARGNYSGAEKMYSDALHFWNETQNAIWQANLLNNLGYLQHLKGNYEAAASTLEKALQHALLSGYSRIEAFALTSIGDLYRELGAIDEAEQTYLQAQNISNQIGEQYLIITQMIGISKVYEARKDYSNAKTSLTEAYNIAKSYESIFEEHLCLLEQGYLQLQQKDFQAAINDLEKAYQYFSNENHLVEEAKSNLFLAIAYHEIGEKNRGHQYLKNIFIIENREFLAPTLWQLRAALEKLKKQTEIKTEVLVLLQEAVQFGTNLPKLKRRMRKQAVIIPFAPPKIHIRALGKMEVRLNSQIVSNNDWQTQTAKDVFFMLLAHPEGMKKEEIGLAFWPDSSTTDLKFRFKNTIYRIRRAIGKETIILENDYYRFNTHLDYEYDVEDFLKAIETANKTNNKDERLLALKTAVENYQGQFLPEIDSTWVEISREKYKQLFFQTTMDLAKILYTEGRYQKALDITQQILMEDKCWEAAYRLEMQIYSAMGNRAAIAYQYERCKNALEEQIGAPPSKQTQRLYERLMR